MKTRVKILIIFAILAFLLICCFTIFSLATDLKNDKTNTILTEEKLLNRNNTYEKISDIDKFDKNLIYTKIKEYIKKINLNKNGKVSTFYSNFQENKYDINFYKNDLNSKTESVIEFEEDIIRIDANNGDLISYTQKNPSLLPTNLNESEIKNMALELYKAIDLETDPNFELTDLQKYDDEIWTAIFDKRYGDLINPGESIRLSFAPESQEIVNIVVLNYPFENNNIEISQEQAYKIAKEYMNKTTATDMEMELRIICPNYFWYKNSEEYKIINKFRKAYVFTCNDEAEVEIYVDCTTGEVIGGNMILGGAI